MAAIDILQTLVHEPAGLNVKTLVKNLNSSYSNIQRGCRLLVDRGLADRVNHGVYRLTDAGLIVAQTPQDIKPRVKLRGRRYCDNSYQAKVWLALRIRRKATAVDLVSLTSPTEDPIEVYERKLKIVQHYLCALSKVAYVGRLPNRRPGTAPESGGYIVWVLLKNTGPLAPSRIDHAIYDHNTGEEIPIRGISHG